LSAMRHRRQPGTLVAAAMHALVITALSTSATSAFVISTSVAIGADASFVPRASTSSSELSFVRGYPVRKIYLSTIPRSSSRLQVQLPSNDQERAINDIMLQIAVQNGDDVDDELKVLRRQQITASDQDSGTAASEDDLRIVQPTLLFAGGMGLLLTAAIGTYLVENGLLSVAGN